MRGISTVTGKDIIINYILEHVKKADAILDVGFGSGIYGKLLNEKGYHNIDGIDIYGGELEGTGLDSIYRTIFIEDIQTFKFNHYNLIIMGDILEHLPLQNAKFILKKLSLKCDHLMVSVPYQFSQNGTLSNPYEKHEQPEITREYMTLHYPYLTLLFESEMEDVEGLIGVYIHSNNKVNE